MKPNDAFIINTNTIVAKYDTVVSINESNYDEMSFIETSDFFILPGVIDCWISEHNDFCNIVLPYNVKLRKTTSMDKSGDSTTIYYSPDDIVIFQDVYDDQMNMGFLKKLLDGNIKYIKDPESLVNFISRSFTDIDLVHIELIVSNMFRSSSDTLVLCRYSGNYKNSIIIGQSKQPLEDSWTRALTFQHIDKAISKGLIGGRTTPDSPFDKILRNDFS
jgi:hypothetical protein